MADIVSRPRKIPNEWGINRMSVTTPDASARCTGSQSTTMWRRTHLAAAVAFAMLMPASSFAGVNVRFVNPEGFTDAGSNGFRSADAGTLTEIRAYLQRLGGKFLAPGQNLTIDILDIDRAGMEEPWRGGSMGDVRIMRGVTPPRIKLRYVLNEKGRRARSGEETLTDINYQMNPSARFGGDRLVYEKALLDDWFRRMFPRDRF